MEYFETSVNAKIEKPRFCLVARDLLAGRSVLEWAFKRPRLASEIVALAQNLSKNREVSAHVLSSRFLIKCKW